MNKTVLYLLYAFAVSTVLAMSASTIVLGLLIIVLARDLYQHTVSKEDFKKDSLFYVALFSWKAFTRALATSIAEIPKIKGVWDRIPYLVIGFYRIHRGAVIRIFHILFMVNTIIVLYALGQKYFDIPFIYKPLFYDAQRISGYTGHPNQYAGCISIIFIMNLCIARYHDQKFYYYIPILLVGVMFAGARSYFLGIMVSFIVLLFLLGSRRKILKYAAIAIILVALIMLILPSSFTQRIADSFSLEKNVYRLNFWKISWNAFLEHPVTGIGSGMLQDYLEPYREKGIIDNSAHAHSLYIHELAENGIPGFILVIGVHFYFLIKYWRVFEQTADSLLKALSLGIALSFVNILVAGIFEHNFGAAIVAMNINFIMGVLEGYRSSELIGQG